MRLDAAATLPTVELHPVERQDGTNATTTDAEPQGEPPLPE